MTRTNAQSYSARSARTPGVACALVIGAALALPKRAHAHGESVRGIGGVGINTVGGAVAEGYSLGARYDLRSYSLFTDAELLEFQRRGENVHQHAREHTAFLAGSFGLAPRWDFSVLLQANRFENFTDNGDAYALANATLSRTDTSQGLGDLLLLGRYQFLHVAEHHFAGLGGLKLPTGNIRQRTNQGDIVGTHNQPGSGSVDFQIGGAYSGEFDPLLVAADLLARVNTEGAGSFRSGNSIQADFAVGCGFFSVLIPSVELNAFFQEQDIEQDLVKNNSGVRSLFFTPGLRASVGVHTFLAAVSLPVWQDFPGISNSENFRLSIAYGIGFETDEDHHDVGGDEHEH